jgi:hypothetical protein
MGYTERTGPKCRNTYLLTLYLTDAIIVSRSIRPMGTDHDASPHHRQRQGPSGMAMAGQGPRDPPRRVLRDQPADPYADATVGALANPGRPLYDAHCDPLPPDGWGAVMAYNEEAVEREIRKDKRIKRREAKLIHALLKGRK